jgi:hypothetical protein
MPDNNQSDKMTLRDQFAIVALNKYIEKYGTTNTISWYADHAYKIADAMMKERLK